MEMYKGEKMEMQDAHPELECNTEQEQLMFGTKQNLANMEARIKS